jgi:orotate phosphoribosyltransferase
MDTAQITQEFLDAEAMLKGHFILSSGLHSDTYLQCARVLMNPARAGRLCAELAKRVRETLGTEIDVVVAPAMGGVVVGYEMARQLGIDGIFCERENGSFTLRRGFHLEKGQRVLLVEDVVTTGKSSLETVTCIESYGATVVGEASLIDRSGGKHNLPFPLISLLTLNVEAYEADNIPAELAKTPAIKPGSRWLKAQ